MRHLAGNHFDGKSSALERPLRLHQYGLGANEVYRELKRKLDAGEIETPVFNQVLDLTQKLDVSIGIKPEVSRCARGKQSGLPAHTFLAFVGAFARAVPLH